jgi:hypothetical protein
MASTQNKQKVSDMLFDVKQKLTDEEYKNIMDGLKKINEKKYVKIGCVVFSTKKEPESKIDYTILNTICQVDKPSEDCQYHNICVDCVLDPDILELWKKHKDDKSFWPKVFRDDNSERVMTVCEFEEL